MTDIYLKIGNDHTYFEVDVTKKKVVWNKEFEIYTEYVGDEYLESNEEVVYRNVVE